MALIKIMNPNESWEQIKTFINETLKHLAVTHEINHIVYKILIELTDSEKKFIGQMRIEAIQIYYLLWISLLKWKSMKHKFAKQKVWI